MNNKIDLKLDKIDDDLASLDLDKSNQSITDNNTNNNFSINNTDNGPKPVIRKTKTSKSPSKKKQKSNKKNKTPKKHKSHHHSKNNKKVKFKEKVDIIKVECWKQYNLEQTAEENEYYDEIMDDLEDGDTNDKKNNNDKGNNNNKNDKDVKNDNKSESNNDKNENNNKKNTVKRNRNNNKTGKGKKGNYSCTCIIIQFLKNKIFYQKGRKKVKKYIILFVLAFFCIKLIISYM